MADSKRTKNRRIVELLKRHRESGAVITTEADALFWKPDAMLTAALKSLAHLCQSHQVTEVSPDALLVQRTGTTWVLLDRRDGRRDSHHFDTVEECVLHAMRIMAGMASMPEKQFKTLFRAEPSVTKKPEAPDLRPSLGNPKADRRCRGAIVKFGRDYFIAMRDGDGRCQALFFRPVREPSAVCSDYDEFSRWANDSERSDFGIPKMKTVWAPRWKSYDLQTTGPDGVTWTPDFREADLAKVTKWSVPGDDGVTCPHVVYPDGSFGIIRPGFWMPGDCLQSVRMEKSKILEKSPKRKR